MTDKEKKDGQKKYWKYLQSQYEKRKGQDLETPLFSALEAAAKKLKEERIKALGEQPKLLPTKKARRRKKK